MEERTRCGGGLKLLGSLAAVMLMTGCATTVPSGTETEGAICQELRRDLPTFSRQDTEQTKQEGADFLDVFNAICPPIG